MGRHVLLCKRSCGVKVSGSMTTLGGGLDEPGLTNNCGRLGRLVDCWLLLLLLWLLLPVFIWPVDRLCKLTNSGGELKREA